MLLKEFGTWRAGRFQISRHRSQPTDSSTKPPRARYLQIEVNRGLPAKYLVKYFTRAGLDWQICDALRSYGEVLPAIRPADFDADVRPVRPRSSAAMCLIYFDVDTKKQILARNPSNVEQPVACWLWEPPRPRSTSIPPTARVVLRLRPPSTKFPEDYNDSLNPSRGSLRHRSMRGSCKTSSSTMTQYPVCAREPPTTEGHPDITLRAPSTFAGDLEWRGPQ
jgi:hypothetical protein